MGSNLLTEERPTSTPVPVDRSSMSPANAGMQKTQGVTRRWFAAVLIVFGLALYGQTLHYEFVYDDDSFVVLNEAIRDLRNTPKFFTEPGTLASDQQLAHDNYRPLVTLSYALNYALGANDPFGYRLFNLLLHICNALLVFWLALRIFKREMPAFITAAIFLAHPVQVESVVFVSSRSNLLSLAFMLGSWLFCLRGEGRREKLTSYFSVLLFACALLCKEMAIVLPGVIVLWDVCFGRGLKKGLLQSLPYFLVAGLYFGLRSAMLGHVAQSAYWGGDLYHTMLTMSRGFAEYVRLALWPHPLSVEYLFDVSRSINDPRVLRSLALLASLLATAIWNLRRRPVLAFGILFFFIGLSPVSNLIPIKSVINERFMYLSMIGWGLAAADLLGRLRYRTIEISALALVSLSLLTMVRSEDWRTGMALVEATLKTAPQSARMHYGLGRQYASRGEWKKAVSEFQLCLAIDPAYDEASNDLIRMAGEGNFDPAMLQNYRQTLQTRVQVPETLFELGTTYLKGGKIPEAIRALESAVKGRPNPEWQSNLAAAYATNGDLSKAIQLSENILKKHPEMDKVERNLEKWRSQPVPPVSAPRASDIVPFVQAHFPQIAPRLALAAGSDFEPLPDGLKLKEGYLGSAQPQGVLKPAERAALEALARRDGSYGQSTPEFFFPKKYGTVGVQLTNEYQIKETPLGASSSPAEVENGLLTYRHVYSHADVFYVVLRGEMEKMILIRRAPSLSSGHLRTFTSVLEGNTNIESFKVENEKLIVISHRTKQPVLQLSAPVVFDAAGKKVSARYDLAGNRLSLSFDDSGLTYPLLIDPTWSSAGGGSLSTARYSHTSTLLPNGNVLIAGGYAGVTYYSTAELYNPRTGTWLTTGSMASSRAFPTATLLPNGNVLLIGGYDGSNMLSSVELYNPGTGSWSTTGSMASARDNQSSLLLPNGRVLVVGGLNSGGTLSTAELYNPGSGTWSTTGSMATTRRYQAMVLIPNGNVLAAAGFDGGNVLSTAELYNPGLGTWSTTNSMATARDGAVATVLATGNVLVTGGFGSTYLSTSELYNPGAGTWSTTGALLSARISLVAALLPNGKVIVAGGNAGGTDTNTAELYDPGGGTWSATGSMATTRESHTATMLANGSLLVVGGTNGTPLSAAELYNPTVGSWSTSNSMASTRYNHTATLLPTGNVLIAGGQDAGGTTFSTAELYNPGARTWSATGSLSTGRYLHSATLLTTGKVLVTGGWNGSTPYITAELYNPGTGTWSATGSMVTGRYSHSTTLLPNGKILVTGGTGTDYFSTSELYDPNGGTWSTTGSMSSGRYSHTATLLASGKVLVAGGVNSTTRYSTAELYDPGPGTWSATGSMGSGKFGHSATLLPNGKVLVAGGFTGAVPLSTTELYDPSNGTWSTSGLMSEARFQHNTALLPSGNVLLIGGNDFGSATSGVELYNPASGAWSTVGSVASGRYLQTATLLPNGNVFVAGGTNGSALSTSELINYSEYVPVNGSSPTVTYVSSHDLALGQSLTINGTNYLGVSEASGGNGVQNSPTNAPKIYLQSIDPLNGNYLLDVSTYIYANAANTWSTIGTQLTLTLPTLSNVLPVGWYQLRAESNGIISDSQIVKISTESPVGNPTIASVGCSTITATWSSVSSDLGYVVEASTSPTFAAPLVSSKTTNGAATSLALTGFSTTGPYYVRIGSLWNSGTTNYLNPSPAYLNLGGSVSSIASGNWSNPATWNPAIIPDSCSPVTISVSNTVTIDTGTAIASTTTINGTLSFSRVVNSTLTLVGGNIAVNSGGTLDMGTAGSPVPQSSSATLVLAYGTLQQDQYGLIINNGGNFLVYGAPKTPATTATSDVGSGVTSFTVGDATGWQIGDLITVDYEAVTILGISGNTISNYSPGLSFKHYSTSTVRVNDLSRNVVVKSSGTSLATNSAYLLNLVQNTTSFNVNYGEFVGLGSNVNQGLGIDFESAAGSISSSTARSGFYGIYLNNTSNVTLTANNVYGDQVGIYLSTSSHNTLTANNAYFALAASGIVLYQSFSNSLTGNNIYMNAIYSMEMNGSLNNNLVSNTFSGSNGIGLYIHSGAWGNQISSSSFYANLGTGIISGSTGTICTFCTFGYTPSGVASPNTTAQVAAGQGGNLTLKNALVYSTNSVDTTQFTSSGTYLLSYNQNFSTGTVLLYGDYRLSGPTMRLDYNAETYTGAGDQFVQKKLLFGPSASSFDNGRSKITLDNKSSFHAVGVSTAPTLISWINSSATYYTFVDSGVFTVEFASFTNMDENGIQLSGTGAFSINDSTFDATGAQTGVSTATLFTLNGVTQSTINVVGVTYGSSGAAATKYNYTILGSSTGLSWTNYSYSGGLTGNGNEQSDPGSKINWSGTYCSTITAISSGSWSSASTWDVGLVPTSCNLVVIPAAKTVTVDILSATASTVTINGTLAFSRSSSSTLTMVGGNMTVNSGGVLDMGTSGSPITSVTAALILSSGTYAGQYGLTVNAGGSFQVYGAAKTPFTTATSDPSGTNLPVVPADVVNWSTGDVVTISATDIPGANHTEARTIAGISGGNITLGSYNGSGAPLSYVHYSTWTVYVTNLTRNVLVRSSGTVTNSVNGNSAYILDGIIDSATNFSLTNGEFSYLGSMDGGFGNDGITLPFSGRKIAISSSSLHDCGVAVFLNGASASTLANSVFYANSGDAIHTQNGSAGVVISGNHFISNVFYGVENATQVIIRNNYFYSNNTGVQYANSSTILSNKMFSNVYGTQFFTNSNNLIVSNDFYLNGLYGVSDQGSINNTYIDNVSYANSIYGFLTTSSSETYFGGSIGYNRMEPSA